MVAIISMLALRQFFFALFNGKNILLSNFQIPPFCAILAILSHKLLRTCFVTNMLCHEVKLLSCTWEWLLSVLLASLWGETLLLQEERERGWNWESQGDFLLGGYSVGLVVLWMEENIPLKEQAITAMKTGDLNLWSIAKQKLESPEIDGSESKPDRWIDFIYDFPNKGKIP